MADIPIPQATQANSQQTKAATDDRPPLKIGLDALRTDLEQKRKVITELIESMKPLEDAMNKSEAVINSLRQRITEQEKRIEALAKESAEHKTQLQTLSEANKQLNEKVVEKEGTINILKDRLKEKTDILKAVDEKNRQLEQDAIEAKKRAFGAENKLGAIEKRVYEGDERNQQLMLELIKAKEGQKQMQTLMTQKTADAEQKIITYRQQLEAERLAAEEKRRLIMETQSKRLSALNAEMAALRALAVQQKTALSDRVAKEKQILKNLSMQIGELASSKTEFRMPDIPPPEEESASPYTESYAEQDFMIPPPEEEGEEPAHTEFHALVHDTPYQGPSRVQEIVPMAEVALEHGDSPDLVKKSLLSTGYTQQEIEEAFATIKTAQ